MNKHKYIQIKKAYGDWVISKIKRKVIKMEVSLNLSSSIKI